MSLRTTTSTLVAASLALAIATLPGRAQSIPFVEAYFDGDIQGLETIDGLSDAFGTTVSADGLDVYVCSGIASLNGSDNAVAAFSRAADGTLTFTHALFDDDDGGTADGLASCRDVLVSPDGKHVYTAGASEVVGIFSRDAATGRLTPNGAVTAELRNVQSIAITSDGATARGRVEARSRLRDKR